MILALIVPDIGDTGCDTLGLCQPDSTISAHESRQSDPCVDFCVPDCFCCSTITPAITVAVVHEPTLVCDLPALPVHLLVDGVSPVLDHIPLTAV